jgi:hypothetical protein
MCCLCVALARRRQQQQQQQEQLDPVHNYGLEADGGRRNRPRGRADLGVHGEGSGWQQGGKHRRGNPRRPRSEGRYTTETGGMSPRGPLGATASRNNWFTAEEELGRSNVVTPPSRRQHR